MSFLNPAFVLAGLCLCLGLTPTVSAQALPPIVETAIVVDSGPQTLRDAVSDRVGGHYILYDTYNPGRDDTNVYLHRVGGRSAWASPIRINERRGQNEMLALTRDGIAVAWRENREGVGDYLRVQKYSFAGSALWTPTPVAGPGSMQINWLHTWLSTGSGFLAVARGYTGPVDGLNYVLYKIGADGALVSKTILAPLIASRGDLTSAACTNRTRETIIVLPGTQVIAHKVGPTGELLWGASGISVTSDFSAKSGVRVACDRTGGAIITWSDNRRTPTTLDYYAQNLDTGGRPNWRAGGVEIARDAGVVGSIDIATDDAGGAYIVAIRQVRDEKTTFTLPRVFGFHIRADGRLDVGVDGGLWLETIPAISRQVEVVSDGRGGAFASWQAATTGGRLVDGVAVPSHTRDISCIAHTWLRIDGPSPWGTELARVGQCSSTNYPRKLVVSNGSVTSFWNDIRSGYQDVYRWTFDAPGATAAPVLVAPARLDQIITPRTPSNPRIPAKLPAGARKPFAGGKF